MHAPARRAIVSGSACRSATCDRPWESWPSARSRVRPSAGSVSPHSSEDQGPCGQGHQSCSRAKAGRAGYCSRCAGRFVVRERRCRIRRRDCMRRSGSARTTRREDRSKTWWLPRHGSDSGRSTGAIRGRESDTTPCTKLESVRLGATRRFVRLFFVVHRTSSRSLESGRRSRRPVVEAEGVVVRRGYARGLGARVVPVDPEPHVSRSCRVT